MLKSEYQNSQMNTQQSKLLILSVALNGYQLLYSKELKSHKRYAQRIGANYLCVQRPFISRLGVECCWLKIHLMLEALTNGYDAVLFLDADTLVREHCPDIRSEIQPEHFIYLAHGYTNRFNSGVILMTKNANSIRFLIELVKNRHKPVAEENSVGWGENGHIIELAKNWQGIKRLHHRWNNTFDESCSDYILHKNHGPLRANGLLRLIHKLLSRLSKANVKLQNLFANHEQQIEKANKRATLEVRKICHYYPVIANPYGS